MCGTDIAYAAMRGAVLRSRMLLRQARCYGSVCCYAMRGTASHGAMRCAVLASHMVLCDARY
eukprot:1469225-Rhodomonas_salina.1